MCGIVGLISRKSNGFYASDLDAFQNLLVFDTTRGLDSTGVFSVNRQHNINMMKIASHPFHLFACKEWEKFRSASVASGRVLIGHNRHATRGAVVSDNAHPFHEGNIVMVHNGSLRGDYKKDHGEREVDSHALALAFSEKGAEEVIPTIDGAFALVWWDIDKNKLFAVRNDERPLNLVLTEDVLAIVSEPWMAYAALAKAGRKIVETVPIPPGKLYEFDMNGNFKVTDIKLRPETHVQMYSNTAWENPTNPKPRVVGEIVNLHRPSTTTTSTTSTTSSCDTDDIPPLLKANFSLGDTFGLQKGERVLLKIVRVSEDGGLIRLVGTINHPGKPVIDMVSMVNSKNVKETEWSDFLEKQWTGIYLGVRNSNCGPSAWINKVELAEMVEVHNGQISKAQWEFVKANEPCRDCTAIITEEDREFTSVSHSATKDKYKVVCPDCVQDKLQGELKDAFQSRRSGAVQNGEPVSNELAEATVDLPQDENSPTLH